ncbi:alpha/beta hydrolase [bacterium]|nr:alpha/beta hydrolase [bacterium]
MGTTTVRFPGGTGAWLVGKLERPDGPERATALFAHCFTCGKDLKSIVRLTRELAARGVASLRFDFSGVGESEGDFAETSFSTNVADILAAADFLRGRGLAPALLVGHSLGGTATLAAAGRVAEARLVATIAAVSRADHFRETLLRLAPELPTAGRAEIVLGGRRVALGPRLLDGLDQRRLDEEIAALGKPLLVFHSPQDETVPFAEAERIFALARPPKSFLCLDGADHLLLRAEKDVRYVAAVLAAALERGAPEA